MSCRRKNYSLGQAKDRVGLGVRQHVELIELLQGGGVFRAHRHPRQS